MYYFTGSYKCEKCYAEVSRSNIRDWPHGDITPVVLDEIWWLLKIGYAGTKITTPNPEEVSPFYWLVEIGKL